MIGFNELGRKGWLGNQMFQYASLRGIAANRGYDFCIPPNDHTRIHNYSLFECFELTNCSNIGYINAQTYYADTTDLPHSCCFEFSEKLFNECPDNVNINGFLQTEKYFKHIESSIKEDFTFKKDYLEPCTEFISQFSERPLFLHVRRNDYVKHPDFHYNHSVEYYIESLKYFDDDLEVLIFSDDMEWCKQQEFFNQDRFYFSESTDRFNNVVPDSVHTQPALIPFVDLCLMSLCNGAIIPNSTLSWWGSWLQKDRDRSIICPTPDKWFGPQYPVNTKDICPENWIRV